MNIPPMQGLPVAQCNVDINGAQLHIPMGPGITLTVSLAADQIAQIAIKLKEEQKKHVQMMQTIEQVRRSKG